MAFLTLRVTGDQPSQGALLKQGVISPLHDVPLFVVRRERYSTYHMVVENPKGSSEVTKIAAAEFLNPIKQVIKNGRPKMFRNARPYKTYPCNYGTLPQTWLDPSFKFDGVNCTGINRSIDALEIGERVATRGEVLQVKMLGAIIIIVESFIDIKAIVIDVNDRIAPFLKEMPSVLKFMKGKYEEIRKWLLFYDVPRGGAANHLLMRDKWACNWYTELLIAQAHECWKALHQSGWPNAINRANVTLLAPYGVVNSKYVLIWKRPPRDF